MRRLHFFWLFLAACSSGPSAVPAKPLRDFRGIIHCHSLYSHDSKGTYEEILAAAKAAKVDFICMTDHPPKGDHGLSLREGWSGLHEGVLFIQGAEYGDNILGLGLREPISGKDRQGTIRAIHDQGGVAIACHPEGITDWSEFDEADGMEIYNVHAAVMKHKTDPLFAAKAIKKIKEDPDHSFQLLQELDPANLDRWDRINLKRRFTGIAGNDSHQNVNFLGYQLDPYPRGFRFVSTHVLARELTREAILDALRKARAYVAFDLLGDPDEFAFAAGGCCGQEDWAEKCSPYGSDVEPWAESHGGTGMWMANSLPAVVRGIRVGPDETGGLRRDPMPTATKSTFVEEKCQDRCFLVPPGLYRVEIYRKSGDVEYPWILPNPIWIGPKRP